MDKRIFKKVFQITEVGKLSEEERMAYEASIKATMDWDGVIAYATQEAERKATEEERRRMEKLLAKERAKAEQDKIQSAEKMLTSGLSIADTAEYSGLSQNQITKIQADLAKKKK